MTQQTRWQIWGRWRGGRETFLADIDVYSNRSDELADMANSYGPNWQLWLEAFPLVHPHKARGYRDADITLGEIKIKPEERGHIYAVTTS